MTASSPRKKRAPKPDPALGTDEIYCVKKPLSRGEKVCAFIEKYCLAPEGDHIGKPIVLEYFQRRFILEIYDNPHGTHSAYLSIARKNGKTALIGAILLAHLVGPEAVQNSQIVSGAQSKEQAAVVFELARKMVEMSIVLAKLVKVQPSGKRLIGLVRNVLYRALAAEGKTAHGLSPILAILDEVGQVVGPVDKFVSAITSAQGAYSNPLLIAISTQAPTDADLFSTWIDSQASAPDPRVVCHVYTAPIDCALDDPKGWAAANPALGIFRSLADLQKQCKQAMDMPANEPEFRNLILNQRVESSAPFVARSTWEANSGAPGSMAGRKVWAGLDLSEVNDLTALVATDDTGGVHCDFWLPAEGLREKSRKDKVPFDLWAKEGRLHTTPGSAIEYEFIAKHLRKFFNDNDVQAVGFDRYNMRFLKPWLVKEKFTDVELEKFIEFGQGTASMTPALRELEVRLLNKTLRHGSHPILNMCAANAKVVGDSGARKFDKKKARGRIDGMVALAMAVGVMPTIESTEDINDFLNSPISA
ncbi:MAG: terminase large subunit [Pseudomonadota bacterium]|nr:terminase large subunit [Pseudomonadota bacterium]